MGPPMQTVAKAVIMIKVTVEQDVSERRTIILVVDVVTDGLWILASVHVTY